MSKNKIKMSESDFSVNKEDQLKVFEDDKKPTKFLPQEVIDKFKIKPVSKPSGLSKRIAIFNSSSYEKALEMAQKWEDEYNQKSTDKKVKLENYYAQRAFYTVLVGYTYE